MYGFHTTNKHTHRLGHFSKQWGPLPDNKSLRNLCIVNSGTALCVQSLTDRPVKNIQLYISQFLVNKLDRHQGRWLKVAYHIDLNIASFTGWVLTATAVHTEFLHWHMALFPGSLFSASPQSLCTRLDSVKHVLHHAAFPSHLTILICLHYHR